MFGVVRRRIVIRPEDPGLLILASERGSQRSGKIRNGSRKLAVHRLEIRHPVPFVENLIDLECPDMIANL